MKSLRVPVETTREPSNVNCALYDAAVDAARPAGRDLEDASEAVTRMVGAVTSRRLSRLNRAEDPRPGAPACAELRPVATSHNRAVRSPLAVTSKRLSGETHPRDLVIVVRLHAREAAGDVPDGDLAVRTADGHEARVGAENGTFSTAAVCRRVRTNDGRPPTPPCCVVRNDGPPPPGDPEDPQARTMPPSPASRSR